MAVRALVFDFDGLILDTETPIFAAWRTTFEEHGCEPLTIEEWSVEIGTVGALDVLEVLRVRSGRPFDAAAVQARRRAHRDELLAREVARPGVVDWLVDARTQGLRLAIASSSDHEWVDGHLRRLRLREFFEHLACFGNGLAAKPAPDTYLDACAALGVRPADAVAIEDSPHGVAAARRAGMRTIAVPNPITEQLDLSAADLVLPSFVSIALASALAQVAE